MKQFEVKAIKRTDFGKQESRSMRREGLIPCALYGNGDTVHFSLTVKDVRPLIYTASSFIVVINFGEEQEIGVMKEVQFHPVREQVLHIDFYRAAPGKPVAIDIPLLFEGNAPGVREGGGMLNISRRKVHVSGLFENLPDELIVDISKMQLNDTIFVGDLDFEGLKLLTPKSAAVCSVKMTRIARGVAAAAEGEEGEEGEGEEGEETEGEGGEGATEEQAEK